MSGSIRRFLLALLLISAALLAQSRPESAASRPDSRLSVRRLPLPIKGDASVPAGCSFSPDGRWLAIARGYDHRELVIFDFAKREAVYEDRSDDMKSAANWPPAFGPKSNVLAYTLAQGLATLELRDGAWKPGRKIDLPFKPWITFPTPRTLGWSADGTTILIAEHEGASRIDLTTGKAASLEFEKSQALWASFPGPNLAMALCSNGNYETVMLSGSSVVERLPRTRILAASADGRSWLVAVGGRCTEPHAPTDAVEIWDALTRRPRARLEPPESFCDYTGVCQGTFSADGAVLITGDFQVVHVRDGRTGAILHTIKYYAEDRIVALSLSPDGRHLLTMGRPGTRDTPEADGVVLWELTYE